MSISAVFKLLATAAVGIALAGCATSRIETSGDASTLPAFSTFEIHDEQYAFVDPLSDQQRAKVSAELRQSVVAALTERGYREAKPGDVWVVIGVVTRDASPTRDQESARGINQVATDMSRPELALPDTSQAPYYGREGDLILYLLDTKTEKTLWRASSTGTAGSPSEAITQARATFKAMAEKLPMAVSR